MSMYQVMCFAFASNGAACYCYWWILFPLLWAQKLYAMQKKLNKTQERQNQMPHKSNREKKQQQIPGKSAQESLIQQKKNTHIMN